MPPASARVATPQIYCGLARHRLQQPSRAIRDPRLLRFGQRIKSDLSLGTALCLTCYQKLLTIYQLKVKHARQHLEKRTDEENTDDHSEDFPER